MKMGLTLQDLLKLEYATSEALGWNGGGRLDVSYNVINMGDVWLDFEIHDSRMVELGPDLYTTFDTLYGEIKNIWGQNAKTIQFCDTDDEKNQSGYYVSIELEETVEKNG
jgi:hypothetical protein